MGKFAERLAQKKGPLYDTAKDLVRLARQCAEQESESGAPEEDDDDASYQQVCDQVERLLGEHKGSDFNQIVGLALGLASAARDGDMLRAVLQDAFEELTETAPTPDDQRVGFLFTIPLVAHSRSSVDSVPVADAQANAISQILKEHALVESGVELHFYPRLLSAAELAHISYFDAYRLTRALTAGDLLTAETIFDGARSQAGAPAWDSTADITEGFEESSTTLGALVGVAVAEDGSVFPANEAFNELLAKVYESEEDGDALVAELQEEVEDAANDLQDILGSASRDFSAALKIPSLQLLLGFWDWYRTREFLQEQAREHAASTELEQLRRQYSEGTSSRLVADSELLTEEPDTLVAQIRISTSAQPVALLRWPRLAQEQREECEERFGEFLHSKGLANAVHVEDGEPETDPNLHRPASAYLH